MHDDEIESLIYTVNSAAEENIKNYHYQSQSIIIIIDNLIVNYNMKVVGIHF